MPEDIPSKEVLPDSSPKIMGSPEMGRRKALGMLAGVIGTVAGGYLWRRRSVEEETRVRIDEPRKESEREREREIEDQFEITLDGYDAEDWNSGQLDTLASILQGLPEYFYKPDEKNRKLRIVLTESYGGECLECAYYPEVEEVEGPLKVKARTIFIGKRKFFRPETEQITKVALTHELTHTLTPFWVKVRDKSYPKWYQQVEEITGWHDSTTRFDVGAKAADKITNLVKRYGVTSLGFNPISPTMPVEGGVFTEETKLKLREVELRLTPEENFLLDFYTYVYYGMSWPFEWIGVLGSYYYFGKEWFFEHFGDFFPEEKVENLYGFVKDNIFKGREY